MESTYNPYVYDCRLPMDIDIKTAIHLHNY